MAQVFFLFVLLLTACMAGNSVADSPQFRGQNGWGLFAGKPIPNSWSESENIGWKTELPGYGWSAPVVVGNKLFCTSAVAEGIKPKDFAGGASTPQSMGLGFLTKAPDVMIQWTVFCLDKNTGAVLWQKIVVSGKPKFAVHPSNSYATETPVADESGVYVYFGAAGAVAGFSLSGEPLWQKDVGVFKTSNGFGTGSSLAISDHKVFLQNFSEESAEVICFDAASGEQVWKTERDENGTSWASPLIWKNGARTELIISGGSRVDSLDPNTGSQLWTVGNIKAATACSVAADAERIYFGGSDPFSTGDLFALSAGASGDLTPKKKNGEFGFCAWRTQRAAPGMASPVSSLGYVFVAEKSILKCYDAASGERLFQERLPKMKMVNSSPIIVGQQILLVDEEGSACVVKAGPQFEVLGSGKIEDTFWSTPAISDGAIYLRGINALYCIRE